jgi:molybdenum cofactor cytidylyltransferase
MATNIDLCAIILAAGFSSRMGRDKALLPWPPESESSTLLSAAITALKPFTETVIVVAGNNALELTPIAVAHGAELVRNPNPERGQFSSLQTGLRAAIDRGYIAAMITPVDCPPLSSASLQKLCEVFRQAAARGAWAVAPEHNGRRGHPLIAGHPLMQAFLAAPATSNAREVKQVHLDKFRYLAVTDPFLTIDLNTPEEYERAAKGA